MNELISVGDRIGLIDLAVIRLGTIATVVRREPTVVRIIWDDGFDDSGPEGLWDWPHADLRHVA